MRHPLRSVTRLADDSPRGVYPANPPGPEGSKGTRALTGVRGVPDYRSRLPVRMS